jgi:hypothetical protein
MNKKLCKYFELSDTANYNWAAGADDCNLPIIFHVDELLPAGRLSRTPHAAIPLQ